MPLLFRLDFFISLIDTIRVSHLIYFIDKPFFWIAAVSIFFFGLIIGSYLNVVILRLNTGHTTGNDRSRCFSCNHVLGPRNLIPVFSFITQQGRCKFCQSKISAQYIWVELLTALIFLLLYCMALGDLYFGLPVFAIVLKYVFLSVIIALLIVISVYDILHLIIPNKIVYPFIALSFLSLVLYGLDIVNVGIFYLDFLNYFGAGIFFVFLLASLWYMSDGRWMGFADSKLIMGIGFFLGIRGTFEALMIAVFSGALIGICLLVYPKLISLRKKNRYSITSEIPFGPFLVLGFLVYLFFDFSILQYISNLIV